MSIAKEKINQIIQEQPDDSSFDVILRELAFHRMIEKGLDDARKGRTVSDAEIKSRIQSWKNTI